MKKPPSERPEAKKLTTADWFAELNRHNELVGEPFMPEGRDQPPMPPDRKIFD